MENTGYSLSDMAAVTGGGGALGGSNSWVLIILFALIFGWGGGGFGGFGGGSRVGEAYATQADVQRAVDLDTIKQGQAGIISSVKDVAYNNLGEIRDVQTAITSGFAAQQTCCCETQRAIDSVKFDMANYSAAIQANDTANTQKILDALATNRMADMQNQINALQLQNAVAGVVKYPQASTYYAGTNPFCGNGCGCNAI